MRSLLLMGLAALVAAVSAFAQPSAQVDPRRQDLQRASDAVVGVQVMAVDDVFIDNNATVVFRGGGTGGGARAVAWAETAW